MLTRSPGAPTRVLCGDGRYFTESHHQKARNSTSANVWNAPSLLLVWSEDTNAIAVGKSIRVFANRDAVNQSIAHLSAALDLLLQLLQLEATSRG